MAITKILARNNKTLSGKVNLGKMLRETRDLRQFSMTPEQYKRFVRLAKRYLRQKKILGRDETRPLSTPTPLHPAIPSG